MALDKYDAYWLGRGHAARNVAPFGDLDAGGEALLMDALGETGPTSEDNHPRRVALLDAYREAYARAELERLEAAFAEAGGRGVDLAERIDQLRGELGDS